jgi:tetratricopeptide (TPR) repeat protein
LKDSDDPVELFSYALALKREGSYREAIDIYRILIAVRPDARTYNNLANCYVAVQDLETGKELYMKSIERKPLPSALYNLSQVYRETFQFEKGEEYFLLAQRWDSNAVSQFRSIFSRNPNRFVIDEPLSVPDIWEYSRAKVSGTFPAGLSTLPPAIIPAIGIVMIFLFSALTRRFKHWAYRCSRCGKILCPRCERHILWGRMCLQCYRSLVKLDELDAKERISRLLTVYEYQKKRRSFIKAISFLIPGSGHIYAGNVLYGFMFLWLFLFFLFVPIMNSFFVVQMSGFSHLWLNICSVLLMIMVYLLYNAITRRRLAKGWL